MTVRLWYAGGFVESSGEHAHGYRINRRAQPERSLEIRGSFLFRFVRRSQVYRVSIELSFNRRAASRIHLLTCCRQQATKLCEQSTWSIIELVLLCLYIHHHSLNARRAPRALYPAYLLFGKLSNPLYPFIYFFFFYFLTRNGRSIDCAIARDYEFTRIPGILLSIPARRYSSRQFAECFMCFYLIQFFFSTFERRVTLLP